MNSFVARAADIGRQSAFDEAERANAGKVYHTPEETAHFVACAREDISALLVVAGDATLLLSRIKRILWVVVVLLLIAVLERA